MQLTTSSVGRKVLMSVSGVFLLLFVAGHLLGNLTIFAGAGSINAYAAKLQSLGPLLWILRVFMVAMLVIHVYFGILVTLENRAASPDRSIVRKTLSATFAGETMIWTGLLLLAFVVYHLLQFTFRVTPGIVLATDATGRFDVFRMVVSGFQSLTVSLVYLAAMVTLFLHVTHGFQSAFQTLGLSNDKVLPKVILLGKVVAATLLLGYSAIPIAILAGIVTR